MSQDGARSANPNQLVYLPRPHRVKKAGGVLRTEGKLLHRGGRQYDLR